VREEFKLDRFYQKYMNVGGLPIVGSGKVSDAAMKEAGWIIGKMLGGRPEILQAMARNKTRFAVMAYNEYTTDVPEHSKLTPPVYWNRRARGLGATPQAPAVSCGEENLLCHPGDPYELESICIHEFAHAIHVMGMKTVDPTFDARLMEAYEAAIRNGLWKDTYASTNRQEYWAEATQSWFDDNRENDSLHNHVNTRQELKDYDRLVAKLCAEVYGDGRWRYKKPRKREPAGRSHLKGVDLDKLPKFEWKQEPIPDTPRVRVDTTRGTFELQLDYKRAPTAVSNFLAYVHSGLYSNGRLSVAPAVDGRPEAVDIFGTADQDARDQFPPPVKLQPAQATGLPHVTGTISMVSATGNGSVQDRFLICIGDHASLDPGGKNNPQGQSFVAFGKVVQGMEIVKQFHQPGSQPKTRTPGVSIQRMVRLN
jgi:cyclophilin family peptidyl-prolyl cis-trans isomerase